MISAKDIEKSIHHAFALKDKGVAVPTILAVFPEERKYIEAAFAFVGSLRTKKEDLQPSAEVLREIILQLDDVPESAPVLRTHKTFGGPKKKSLFDSIFGK